MKNCKKFSAAVATALTVGGVVLLSILLHRADLATTATQVWLYGILGVAPILIGGAWFGCINRNTRWTESWREARTMSSLFGGAVLITIGIVALLFNTGYIASGWTSVFLSWWMIPVVIGFGQLCSGKGVWGAILMLGGGFFLAPRVAAMFPAIFETTLTVGFIPVLLIGLGVIILVGAIFHNSFRKNCHNRPGCCDRRGDFERRRRGFDGRSWNNDTSEYEHQEVTTEDGTINENLRFSGMDKVILDPIFRGGNIKVAWGGYVLDLRRTTLPEGVTTLNLDAFMAGINIVAPSDWAIEIQSNNSVGGFVDKRRNIEHTANPDRKLVITASFRFGGGEIASTK